LGNQFLKVFSDNRFDQLKSTQIENVRMSTDIFIDSREHFNNNRIIETIPEYVEKTETKELFNK